MDVLAVLPEKAENLDWLGISGAKPVRHLGVELGNFARPHRDVVVAEDEPQPPCQHVEPFVALVRPTFRLGSFAAG